ncbi:MAG: hypothetical protein EAZ69_13750 [Oscillatoriales cyanobacterium]|nr:MAG: hypothetical protein EAZ69_13750 [Oscillatoriales cyanobacterium]
MLLKIATLAIFAPQITKSVSAQSITDKSCVADIVGAPLSRKDSEGNVWYLTTRLRASEYKGWIKADFLRLRCPNP